MKRQMLRAATRAAEQDARSNGCVCKPDINIGRRVNGQLAAVILHDDWCPLAQLATEQVNGELYSQTFIDPEEN